MPIPNYTRKGVRVAFEGKSECIRNCFEQYTKRSRPTDVLLVRSPNLLRKRAPKFCAYGCRDDGSSLLSAFSEENISTCNQRQRCSFPLLIPYQRDSSQINRCEYNQLRASRSRLNIAVSVVRFRPWHHQIKELRRKTTIALTKISSG